MVGAWTPSRCGGRAVVVVPWGCMLVDARPKVAMQPCQLFGREWPSSLVV